MALFNAKDADASHAEHRAAKATKEAQHFATSPFGQRLIEENKALRSALHRLSALEKRMDNVEGWQSEAQPRIQRAKNAVPEFAMTAMEGRDNSCPCGKPRNWTGPRRCFHCSESFGSPAAMDMHTSMAHHG